MFFAVLLVVANARLDALSARLDNLAIHTIGALPEALTASTCSLYEIKDDTCGQSDLDCKYTKYAKIAESGLKDGTCPDQGFTVKTSTQTKKYPVIGTITITEYKKA